MSQKHAPQPPSVAPRPPAGPGRPKDLAKRAAILEAAKHLFLNNGYEGVSMDQIAAEAGVSKLTVYSHFGDKDALFVEVSRTYCEQQLPTSMFEPQPDVPLRERLLAIGRAFFAMVSSPEAVAGHRLLCTPLMIEKRLAPVFWEAGPERLHSAFAVLLHQRMAAGELQIDDVQTAAAQFFVLLKGDLHARLVFHCCSPDAATGEQAQKHVEAAVDMFLRAYATEPARRAS